MQHEWVYDNPSWWRYSIHQCIPDPLGYRDLLQPVPEVDGLCLPTAVTYAEGLRRLNEESADTPIESAAQSLAHLKAMRKWRLAPGKLAAKRRDAALDGWHRRNADCDKIEVPYPIAGLMHDILDRWLPKVPEPYGFGAFGNGKCEEGIGPLAQWRKLTRWCDRSGNYDSAFYDPSWPQMPLLTDRDSSNLTARLAAVPKQFDKDRLITVEPVYRKFGQQFVRQWIYSSIASGPLRGTAFDVLHVDEQQSHRLMALKASAVPGVATVDLKDASDRISWTAVQQVFPSWVTSLLDVVRSTHAEDPRTPGNPIPCYMFAGMGNATTFVVETLFFAAYCLAVARAEGIRLPFGVSCVGDDVICDQRLVPYLLERADACFVINEEKTFWRTGPFRESCGAFAFKGVDIACPRIDGYVNSFEGREAVAALHQEIANRGWIFLSGAIASAGCLENYPFYIDGYPSVVDWSVPFNDVTSLHFRRNTFLQKGEVRVRVPEDVCRWERVHTRADPELAKAVLNGVLAGRITTTDRKAGEETESFVLADQKRRVGALKWRWRSFSFERFCDGSCRRPPSTRGAHWPRA